MGVMNTSLKPNIGSQTFSAKKQNGFISSSADEFVSDNSAEQRLWLSVRDVARRYSCGRSTIYAWIQAGTVRSVSIRRRGNIRGLRRIYGPSVDALFVGAEQRHGIETEMDSAPMSHNGRLISGGR